MSSDFVWKIDDQRKIKLKDYDPNYLNKHVDADEANQELQRLSDELSELQELLAAAQHHSLLMILQGMDTSGKDGTIRHVFAHVSPQGCYAHPFKVPTPEESAHDFLWRVHRVTPASGMLAIFNRSHYEDVLVPRVHKLVPEEVWKRRYKDINHFENLLAHDSTIILKFFLYISYDEQAARLQAREQDKTKAWKVEANDWKERSYWNDYMDAYEDAISACSSPAAPWYIVPANHKWYRNLAIAHTLVHTMRTYKNEWQTELETRGKQELQALHEMRTQRHP